MKTYPKNDWFVSDVELSLVVVVVVDDVDDDEGFAVLSVFPLLCTFLWRKSLVLEEVALFTAASCSSYALVAHTR